MKSPFLCLAVFSSVAFLSPSAFAEGASDRGGGNALVCFDSTTIPGAIRQPGDPSFGVITTDALAHITDIEMLDVYQAMLPRDLRPDHLPLYGLVYPRDGESPGALALRILNRIANYAPGVYAKLTAGERALHDNIAFSNQGVATIDDLNLLFNFDRDHCVIATMAAQDAQNDQLFVDSRLYNHPKNSTLNRAVMWLHEWTYYSLLHKGITTSAGVRSIVGKMILGGTPYVQALLDAAVKAGLVGEGEESMNGVERQVSQAFERLRENIRNEIDFDWYTDDRAEEIYKPWWNYRQELENRIFHFPAASCWDWEECESILSTFAAQTTDPVLKREALSLAAGVQNVLAKFQLGPWILKKLPIKLDDSLPGNQASDQPPLPDYELKDAADHISFALGILAQGFENAPRWAPPRQFDTFAVYQKSMRQYRDRQLELFWNFSIGPGAQFPLLTLPFTED